MLNALNDAQDYDSSAKLVEDLQEVPTLSFMHHPAIQYLYAFALNRYIFLISRREMCIWVTAEGLRSINPLFYLHASFL